MLSHNHSFAVNLYLLKKEKEKKSNYTIDKERREKNEMFNSSRKDNWASFNIPFQRKNSHFK